MELQTGILNSREQVLAALKAGLLQALAQGGREQCWLDRDFSAWPLSDPEVLAALKAWALPHRRLHLLAQHYEGLRRVHPRFVRWRQDYGHVVEAGSYTEEDMALAGGRKLDALLLAPGTLCLRVLDGEHWRAVLSAERPDELLAREWFDAIQQRSSPSFSATTLGL
ncbi:hypothetical protein [Paucibacter soli]|uniref:hypothetical protein n=1 Tax=Paucibacter soli TaxID=3133433 RepID=UPI0030A67A7B